MLNTCAVVSRGSTGSTLLRIRPSMQVKLMPRQLEADCWRIRIWFPRISENAKPRHHAWAVLSAFDPKRTFIG
jgi:hypothetical protein